MQSNFGLAQTFLTRPKYFGACRGGGYAFAKEIKYLIGQSKKKFSVKTGF